MYDKCGDWKTCCPGGDGSGALCSERDCVPGASICQGYWMKDFCPQTCDICISITPTTIPTEAPNEPLMDASTEPPTDTPTEPQPEPPTEPPTESPTEPPTEAPSEPLTEAPTYTSSEPPTDTPTEPTTERNLFLLFNHKVLKTLIIS